MGDFQIKTTAEKKKSDWPQTHLDNPKDKKKKKIFCELMGKVDFLKCFIVRANKALKMKKTSYRQKWWW